MPALLLMFPTAQPSLLFDAHSIISQVGQTIGMSILQSFGLGALGSLQQQNRQWQGGNQASLLAGYAGALRSLTAYHMAGQFLQRSINPSSQAGALLQSRLDDFANARFIAASNLLGETAGLLIAA